MSRVLLGRRSSGGDVPLTSSGAEANKKPSELERKMSDDKAARVDASVATAAWDTSRLAVESATTPSPMLSRPEAALPVLLGRTGITREPIEVAKARERPADDRMLAAICARDAFLKRRARITERADYLAGQALVF